MDRKDHSALGHPGHQVLEAGDGREALDLIEKQGPPDVILLDLTMPRMDGWTFARLQRQTPALAHIPLIVISAADPDRRRSAPPGVTVLAKPFDIGVLLDTVERLCG